MVKPLYSGGSAGRMLEISQLPDELVLPLQRAKLSCQGLGAGSALLRSGQARPCFIAPEAGWDSVSKGHQGTTPWKSLSSASPRSSRKQVISCSH